MCIIAISPKGKQLPSEATRRQMWRRNPDGAGLMYCKNGYVSIEKGFMEFEAMEARIHELETEIDVTETPVILHYRITTHGGTCPQLTHPFPLSASPKALRTTHIRTALGIAHNGIIPIAARPGLSDTAEYIADVLTRLPRNFTQDKRERARIEREINGSRMVFLSGDGAFTKVGHWLHGDDGCWYSNGSYIEPRPVTTPHWGAHQYTLAEILGAQDKNNRRKNKRAKVETAPFEESTPRTYYEDGLLDENGDEYDEVEDFTYWLRHREW